MTYAQSPSPLPSGNNGIAAKYPNGSNIKSDPDVIFADDFESYSSESQLWGTWDDIYQQQDVQITTDPAHVFSGQRSLEMRVPAQGTEIANAVVKKLNPTRDTVFVRVYTKFVAGYNVSGSEPAVTPTPRFMSTEPIVMVRAIIAPLAIRVFKLRFCDFQADSSGFLSLLARK